MSNAATAPGNGAKSKLKRVEKPLPIEGADGVFTQTWYAVCMSDEVGPGQIVGSEFLDGRIVTYRDNKGKAHVVSAYCPHLGARLDNGEVVDDRIQCPFHKFEFDCDGKCIKTGYDAPPPPAARLFVFPTVERFGLIWAFNGEEPLWELPDFEFPDEDLHFYVKVFGEFDADPHVLCCNTPDYQHFRTVHHLEWSHPDPDPNKDFRWTDHSFQFDLEGYHWNKTPMKFTFGIYSTSLYYQQGYLNDKWYGYLTPFKITTPGNTLVYFVVAVKKEGESPEDIERVQKWAEEAMELEVKFVSQDVPVLNGVKFRQGALTKRDLPLAMYLDMVRAQPRAHPSQDFIR